MVWSVYCPIQTIRPVKKNLGKPPNLHFFLPCDVNDDVDDDKDDKDEERQERSLNLPLMLHNKLVFWFAALNANYFNERTDANPVATYSW